MATSPNNNLAQKLSGRAGYPYPIDQTGAAAFNQGDLVYFDTSAKVLKALDSDAHAADLAGVALISSALALYTDALTGAAKSNVEPKVPVGFGDVFNFTGVAGDSYAHMDAVYYATDAQHVTAVGASHLIGYVWLPLGNTLTGAVTVPILVVAQHPVANLA